MSQVYAKITCNLGEGSRTYLFTGNTKFSKIEAREVDAAGDVLVVGGGISVPVKEFKKLLRDSKPHRSTYIH